MSAAQAYSIGATLTAAGTNQATAATFDGKSNVYVIGTATANQGFILPFAQTGQWYSLVNSTGIAVSVYPQVGYAIGSAAANAGYSVGPMSDVTFWTTDGNNWKTSPDVGTLSQSFNRPVVSAAATGTTTLTAAQSGSIVNLIATSGALAVNLPTGAAIAAGMNYDFYVTGSLSGGAVTIGAGSAIIKGNAVATDVTAVVGPSTTAKSNIILGTGSIIGDWVRLTCVDGSTWAANCLISVHTTLTVS